MSKQFFQNTPYTHDKLYILPDLLFSKKEFSAGVGGLRSPASMFIDCSIQSHSTLLPSNFGINDLNPNR